MLCILLLNILGILWTFLWEHWNSSCGNFDFLRSLKKVRVLECFSYLFLGSYFFMWLQIYTLRTLSTDGHFLATWKQLSQRSNKLPSLLWTDSKKEYSGECVSKAKTFFYGKSFCGIDEYFILYSLYVLVISNVFIKHREHRSSYFKAQLPYFNERKLVIS